VAGRQIRLAASLLGTLFFIFVLSLHAPRVAANPADRFAWAVATRDFTFGLGAWMLAASSPEDRGAKWPRVIAACRILAGLVFVFYGAEHMLHPMFVPGVPLERQMGPWVPAAHVWGHVIGLLLIAAGVLMVINVQARAAATALGSALTVTLPVTYVPMLFVAVGAENQVVAVNYIFDSMLFAGIVFLLAGGMPRDSDRVAPAKLSASQG
jgi:hypothetical protein